MKLLMRSHASIFLLMIFYFISSSYVRGQTVDDIQKANSYWSGVLNVSKWIYVVDEIKIGDKIRSIRDIPKDDPALILVTKEIKPAEFKPVNAFYAEGGNKYLLFYSAQGKVVAIIRMIAHANNGYAGFWQMRPHDFELNEMILKEFTLMHLTSNNGDLSILVPYGGYLDKVFEK